MSHLSETYLPRSMNPECSSTEKIDEYFLEMQLCTGDLAPVTYLPNRRLAGACGKEISRPVETGLPLSLHLLIANLSRPRERQAHM